MDDTFLLVLVTFLASKSHVSAQAINYPPEGSNVTLIASFSTVFGIILLIVLFQLLKRFCICCCIKSMFFRDREAINNCPVFVYSAVKDRLQVAECAVCLFEFEDVDTIKMLPKCRHVFHQHCIDAWLPSHMTCPICRQKLKYGHTLINIENIIHTNADVTTKEQEPGTWSELEVVTIKILEVSVDQQSSQQRGHESEGAETESVVGPKEEVGEGEQIHYYVA